MPRCGCSGTCSCLIVAGEGVIVEGIGSIENPYEISSDAAELATRVEFTDTDTIDFTTSGLGSGSSPLVVSAAAKVAISELTDVQGAPSNSEVLVWVDDHWEPQPLPVALPPGGTTGQVLAKVDDTDGNADWTDIPDELPPGGAIGQVLTKQTAADGSVYWATPASGGGGGGTVGPSEPYYAASRRHAGGLTLAAGAIVGIPFDTEDYTEGITWNGTGFVIPVAGYYQVNASVRLSTAGTGADPIARIRVNGSSAVAGMNVQGSVTSVGVTSTIVRTLKLNQGDVVDIAVSSTTANQLVTPQAYYTWVNITKVPSPGGVPTAERVYASRRSINANVSIPNNVETPLVLDQAVTDDGSIGWATSGWIIPVTGWYQINALVGFVANATGVRQVKITQNGASTTYLNSTPGASTAGAAWSRALKCTAGDIINVSVLQNSGAALSTNQVTVDIHKVPETIPASHGIIGERVYAAVRNTSSAQSIPNGSAKVNFDNLERSDGIAWDATNFGYVIPVSGWYDLAGSAQFGSNATGYRILYFSADGVTLGAMSETGMTASGGQSVNLSKSVYLLAGQVVSLNVTQNSGAALALTANATYNFFSITKIPSVFPQSVALGERNYAAARRYANSPALSIPHNVATAIPFDTADYEDGITWDAGVTGFRVSVAGYYQLNARATFAFHATGQRNIRFGLNGSSAIPGIVNSAPVVTSGAAGGTVGVQASRTLKLAAGDYVQVLVLQDSGAALLLQGGTNYHSFDITKVPAPAVAGSAASGVWGSAPLDKYGSDTLQGRPIYVDANSQLRLEPFRSVDCAAEVKCCTDTDAAPNAGSTIYAARYLKVGKTVTYWGYALMGTATVVNGALFLPPSAGVPISGQPHFPPPGIYNTATPFTLAKWQLLGTLDRCVGIAQNSSAYYDFPANTQIIWHFTYEVA